MLSELSLADELLSMVDEELLSVSELLLSDLQPVSISPSSKGCKCVDITNAGFTM